MFIRVPFPVKAGRADLSIGIGLFALALALRVFVLAAVPFDGLYGQDAYAYYDYAFSLRNALTHGRLPPPFFWPLGYPLHVVAAASLVGVTPLAGQIVSLVAGALAAPLTFALAREAWPDSRRAGILAGLIVATAGQLTISSLSIMSDAAGLAWATASAWLTLRYARTLRPGTLALASIALGVAVITRWVFGLLALPWALCVLLAWRRNWPSIGRRAIALSLLAILAGGSIVGAQLLAGESHTGDLQVVGWHPANAFRREVVNSDGTFDYELPMGLFYLIRPLLHPSFLLPLFAPLWLPGLWSLGRAAGPARALLIGWPLIVYVFLAGIAWQSDRFILTLFPPLAVWTGIGFARAWSSRPDWRRGLKLLVIVALPGALAWALYATNDFVARNKNADLARVQRLVERLPAGAQVITFGVTLTLQHYSELDAIEIYHETPASLRARACSARAAYAFLDVASVEQQWASLAPQINFRWLRDGPGLQPIDRFEGYTLFRVGSKCP